MKMQEIWKMNRNDVVSKAKSYIKYWGNPNQFTKWYCHDNKTHAWCGMFVDYIFKQDMKSNWLDDCKNFAYVPTIVEWGKKKGYWNSNWKNAKTGDLVIYNWYPSKKNHYSHVGIVYETKGTGIVSIEGNTTNGSQSNWVAKKSRGKKYVAGVISLPYLDRYNLTRYLKKGCKGDDVKKMQKIIGTTADGIFGKNTLSKLKTWQTNHGLKADGVVGKNTAHKLGWTFKGK